MSQEQTTAIAEGCNKCRDWYFFFHTDPWKKQAVAGSQLTILVPGNGKTTIYPCNGASPVLWWLCAHFCLGPHQDRPVPATTALCTSGLGKWYFPDTAGLDESGTDHFKSGGRTDRWEKNISKYFSSYQTLHKQVVNHCSAGQPDWTVVAKLEDWMGRKKACTIEVTFAQDCALEKRPMRFGLLWTLKYTEYGWFKANVSLGLLPPGTVVQQPVVSHLQKKKVGKWQAGWNPETKITQKLYILFDSKCKKGYVLCVNGFWQSKVCFH